MTWTAGQKADATVVAAKARSFYSNQPKKQVRLGAILWLTTHGVTTALDLWGGGQSAEEMVAAGLSVVSVEDGRDFVENHGISRVRVKRALAIKAETAGYSWGWGASAIEKNASSADGAWLDFMGHLCPAYERALRSCRPMKAIVVTLMAERVKGVRSLSVETWKSMYAGAVESLTGMRVKRVTSYPRSAGSVIVLYAERDKDKVYQKRRYELQRLHEWQAVHKDDQEYLVKHRLTQAVSKRVRRQVDPEFHERELAANKRARERRRIRALTDPEFLEHKRAKGRKHRLARRDELNARQRERYANDPEYRRRVIDATLAYRRRKANAA